MVRISGFDDFDFFSQLLVANLPVGQQQRGTAQARHGRSDLREEGDRTNGMTMKDRAL